MNREKELIERLFKNMSEVNDKIEKKTNEINEKKEELTQLKEQRIGLGIERGKQIIDKMQKESVKENPCPETKAEKMADLEARLYENTLVKRAKKVPSGEELDTLQEKFETNLDDKKEDLLKRKNRILQRLQVEKGLLDENDTYPVKVETKDGEYEMVNHPQHYNNYDVEVVDMMERIWGTKATMEWCKMTAYKYRMRMGTKPGKDETKESMKAKLLEDFEKEQWYLDKAAELKEKLFDQSIDMNQ